MTPAPAALSLPPPRAKRLKTAPRRATVGDPPSSAQVTLVYERLTVHVQIGRVTPEMRGCAAKLGLSLVEVSS